jgi:hypothetical protein
MTIVRGPDYFGDVLGSLRLPCSGRTTPSEGRWRSERDSN